jgi:hypothetical protein
MIVAGDTDQADTGKQNHQMHTSLPPDDLANALLTTAVETLGWSWTPNGASASCSPVRRPVMDLPGPAKLPERRKVTRGGMTHGHRAHVDHR